MPKSELRKKSFLSIHGVQPVKGNGNTRNARTIAEYSEWTTNLSVAFKQSSQSSIDVKNPNRTGLEAVANVRPVHRNLTADEERRIGTVLGDRSDLELRLRFALQPHGDVVDEAVADQVPSPGELPAR